MKRDCRSNVMTKIWKSLSPKKTPVIPIKLSDPKKLRKVGVVVKSLSDLKEKAHSRLAFSVDIPHNSLRAFLEDGTEIEGDEYLLTLHNQLVIVATADFSFDANSLENVVVKYEKAVSELMKFEAQEILGYLEKANDEVFKLSMNYISSISKSKSHLSRKSEHPEWFEGLNTIMDSKEAYLRSCAQGRVKSYLRDSKKRLDGSKKKAVIIDYFTKCLKQNKYFGDYFDRTASELLRLCCSAGVFNCQGKYDSDICTEGHSINPYENSESRLLFSTWNLDHVIERVIILSKLNQVLENSEIEIDEEKYFNLLFTRSNLKLVHRSCHVISAHTNTRTLV